MLTPGDTVTIFQPGPFGGNEPANMVCCSEQGEGVQVQSFGSRLVLPNIGAGGK